MQLEQDDQFRRGIEFRDLHAGPGTFVIPNPWDAGSARILSGLGFRALATTSAGLAYSLGLPDGSNQLGRAQALDNARVIVAATSLPVSADLESGYADDPAGIAETIRLAAEAGLAGGSIEDATGRPDAPIRPLSEAVERVSAAIEAAHALPFPFTLTARAENFLYGVRDLDDTITRLQAFEAAGADVLYAPFLPSLDAIATVCSAVTLPVNVVATAAFTVADLASRGVRRISLGSGLARSALGTLIRDAQQINELGTFSFLADALPYPEANKVMSS
ncbi:MAG TPA: isocitrate lyase/phosphoenolpyruvate mutase family protein [Streptosporangiaceae bacterium]|jgi:2-methylisocitrate lyase-like PEP mutase family enzyme